MNIKSLLAIITMSAFITSGFGATPSKPDFAYPKTVSKNAEAQLKSALKKNNGPEIVRSLLDYGLAQTAINPDKLDATMKFYTSTAAKVKDPATKAMIQLARADAESNDSLAADAITRYDTALKATPTELWKSVVNADVRFFPTLYDFAVAGIAADNDSIRAAAMAYDADRPYPLVYLELLQADNFDEYKAICNKFAGKPAEIYPLFEMARSAGSLDERKEAYAMLKSRQNADPAVAKAIKYLTRPSLTVQANNIVGRGKPLTVKVRAVCLNSASLRVTMDKPTPKTIRTIDLKFDGSGVFEADTTLEISFENYGRYSVTPLFSASQGKNSNSDRLNITVTDFLISKPLFGSKKEFPAMALDVINGALQPDVSIRVNDHRISASRGADIYTPEIYYYNGYTPGNDVSYNASILTDRAIYHPGDTLRFAATLMSTKGRARKLDSGHKVTVMLRNANYERIDSVNAVSDDFGRISGSFLLPTDGLTGRFTVLIEEGGSASVMVTDYKAPTFDVELKAVRIDSTTVELKGNATGYNGFPIADAKVALTVNKLPDWIWLRDFRNFRGSEVIATDTVTTDAAGNFTARISVPAGTNINATATASSPTGESHDAHCFIPFYRYHIEGAIGPFTEAGKVPHFSAIDSEGNRADVDLKLSLLSQSDSVRITPDEGWINVPSGKYTVSVEADNAAPCIFETEVYRPTDAMPPSTSALFVPVTKAVPGTRLLAGTSFADSHILLTTCSADSIIEQRWLTPSQGNFFIDITLPDGVDDAIMTLHTLRDYRFESCDIRISRPDAVRDLKVEISSMRDKVTPGDRETWTLRVTDNLGRPVEAALMLDVYSKALDALAPFNWGFRLPYVYSPRLSFNDGSSYRTYASINGSVAPVNNPAGTTCGFNLYGRRWPYVVEEIFSCVKQTSRSLMMKSAAMNDYGSADMMLAEPEAAIAEDSDIEESVADGAVAGGGATQAEAAANDTYRMPETAVALWQPVLTTAPDGSLQIEFTAPDANTTWAVKALAYDRRLLNGIASAEIIASKPVMIQPQLPRFLRSGDSIELRAMVMNNTDSAASAQSFIEIINPADNSLIGRHEFTDSIAPHSSSIIAVKLDAPADAAMIEVRARATAGNFTDGERSLIPVLPARVDVRTGRPLFISADSTEVTVDVERGGVMTFTANAAWECVTALPGLRASESRSALSAVASLFSAATARGLLRSHPEIGKALHRWQHEDSVLISRLMRNDDLKIALLESTPFVSAAASETEQRARLTLLFDNRETDKAIADAEAMLANLVRKDGGIAWTANSDESSQWITMRAMLTLGRLKRLGYLPQSKGLDRIITGAIEYLDREVAKDFARNKRATYPDYVMVRGLFADIRQSAPARRAQAATVQHLVSHWRDMSLESIARAAIILNDNGYSSTARRLIESLRQHEAWMQMPLSPMLLNAFVAVEPGCAEIDMIRAEYIARKQSMDWGSGPEVSELVASILNSGTTWLIPAANELTVKVNGSEVNSAAESVTGEFRLDLPEGGRVEIAKGRFPAWGGVFSASTDSICRVEPFESDHVKLTRSISGTPAVGEKITLILTIEASRDMDYVVVTQPRCAALEPVDQLPSTLWLGYRNAYREPCPTVTNWFFNRLAKGKTIITETFYVTAAGTFSLAPAELQSQYAPEFQAHTAGAEFTTAPARNY